MNKSLVLCLIVAMCALMSSCLEDSGTGFSGEVGGSDGGDGTNGSYTAMIAVDDRLYYVDNTTLFTSDISNPLDIQVINEQNIGTNIETLFHRNGLLFIGSGPALYIYELDVDRIPTRASETRYENFSEDMVPCDPVVADDKYAYVTLSSTLVTTFANGCSRLSPVNELRIYDISSIETPMLVSTTEMVEPKGLAVDGDIAFICDSEAGLKVYNIADRLNPQLLYSFSDDTTYDVIARSGLLVVTGPSSITEYDYSDVGNMQLIGRFGI